MIMQLKKISNDERIATARVDVMIIRKGVIWKKKHIYFQVDLY